MSERPKPVSGRVFGAGPLPVSSPSEQTAEWGCDSPRTRTENVSKLRLNLAAFRFRLLESLLQLAAFCLHLSPLRLDTAAISGSRLKLPLHFR